MIAAARDILVKFWRSDDAPYILPMAVFLLLTAAGSSKTLTEAWSGTFAASYVVKTLAVGGLLLYFWSRYQTISWRYWWLGIILGVVGIVQWCGVEELLLKYWPDYPRIPGGAAPADPWEQFPDSPALAWGYIAIRWLGPTLVVPFMEELFWRDYLWRRLAAPNDFRLMPVGEWDWQSAIFTVLLFTSVHPQWITALIWGLLITWLLVYTRSLGACILMHAVTNFLLGAYTLYTHKWYYW
jgi:CAAX prenyl protease-like protein